MKDQFNNYRDGLLSLIIPRILNLYLSWKHNRTVQHFQQSNQMHACYGELLKALRNVCGIVPLLVYAALTILFQLSNNLNIRCDIKSTGFSTLQ